MPRAWLFLSVGARRLLCIFPHLFVTRSHDLRFVIPVTPVQLFGMFFARLLRTITQPSLARSAPPDAGRSSSDDSNIPRRGRQAGELMVTIRRRPWKTKRPSTTDQSSPSQSTPIPASTSKAAEPDKLAEAWNVVNDDRKVANTSRAVDADGVS
jgi:hypothetical protein